MLKRRVSVFAVVVALSLVTIAQVANIEKVDLEMMKKIRAEGLERSQIMDTLSWLTDVVGHRLTGSPGMKKANEWTRDKMTSYGLVNAHLESWGPFGRGWSFSKVSVNVVEPTPFPVIAYPEAWTPGTNGAVTAEVVAPVINSDADLDKLKGQLKGKILLLGAPREVKALFKAPGERYSDEELLRLATDEMPQSGGQAVTPDMARRQEALERARLDAKLADVAKAEGALAVLRGSRTGGGGTVFVQSSRGLSRDKNAPLPLPSVVLTPEHHGRIARILQKGVKVTMELDIRAQYHDEDVMGYNTIAEIPGTDKKDEIVMLGGHLDSWHGGTGATDNAAGCAVAMEAVRILKTLGVQPRRTIRVGLWSGEEQGLLGSRAYVAQHFAEREGPPPQRPAGGPGGGGGFGQPDPRPLKFKPAHEKFAGYFNLDNGTGKIRGIYLQGNNAVRPIFRAWLEPFRDLGAATITINNTGGTDHLSFDGVGLPGFQFIQDPVEYDTRTHHSNMDVYERMQADDMKQAATIMAAFVYNAAMREEKLPRKPMPQPQSAGR
jgi:hypothetical protein